MHAALNDPHVRLVNALSADEHTGKVTRVARPGHIPGSANVPAGLLVDPVTNAFLSTDQLRDIFERAGLLGSGRVIAYCGGGIPLRGALATLANHFAACPTCNTRPSNSRGATFKPMMSARVGAISTVSTAAGCSNPSIPGHQNRIGTRRS